MFLLCQIFSVSLEFPEINIKRVLFAVLETKFNSCLLINVSKSPLDWEGELKKVL